MATTPSLTSSWSAGTPSRVEANSNEHAASLGRNVAQRDTALLDSSAAAGATLVYGPSGVAHHDTDPPEWHVKLFGDDLSDRDIHPLAHVHLAEIGDDIAMRFDGEPAVEMVGGERWLYGGAGLRGGETAGVADQYD